MLVRLNGFQLLVLLANITNTITASQSSIGWRAQTLMPTTSCYIIPGINKGYRTFKRRSKILCINGNSVNSATQVPQKTRRRFREGPNLYLTTLERKGTSTLNRLASRIIGQFGNTHNDNSMFSFNREHQVVNAHHQDFSKQSEQQPEQQTDRDKKMEKNVEFSSILTEVAINELLQKSRHAEETKLGLDLLAYEQSMSALPIWLRHNMPPTAFSIDEKINRLRSAMKVHYSSGDINSVIDAVKIASKNSIEKLSGALDFLFILRDIMEMGKTSLIAAAFHYCSCVTVRESNTNNSYTNVINEQETNNFYHPDTQYLFPLTNSRIEEFGDRPMKIAFDLARLKGIENMASTLLNGDNNVTTNLNNGFRKEYYDNLRNLLMSTNTNGDWRALAIRSGACLYRLQALLSFRSRHPRTEHKTHLTPEEVQVAREALYIYAPLAHILGMHRLKSELEGMAFRMLYRRQHRAVTKMLHHVHNDYPDNNISQRTRRDISDTEDIPSTFSLETADKGLRSVLDDLTLQVKRLLHEDDILISQISNLYITARVKEPLSLWRKILKIRKTKAVSQLSVLDIPDVSALRVIITAKKLTPDENDEVTEARGRSLCYYVYELLNSMDTTAQDNEIDFKDYIKYAKENGYQSLHYHAKTRWHGKDWPYEVQIRTSEMHRVAEYGLAAHWEYKMNKKREEPDPYLKSRVELCEQGVHEQIKKKADFPSLNTSRDYKTSTAADLDRTEKIRLLAQKLKPYIEALAQSGQDLIRERVFVFLSYGNVSPSDEQGTIISFRAGACILDAWNECEKRGLATLWTRGVTLLKNGQKVEITDRLGNGDILSLARE